MNPILLASLISASVAALGVVISFISTRKQLRLKSKELDATVGRMKLEHQAAQDQLTVVKEQARQQQATEILKKRIETYPQLYRIISVYGRNWEIEGKPRDRSWAQAFLNELIDNNAKNGVFFSKVVYYFYGSLRNHLQSLVDKLSDTAVVEESDIEKLWSIIMGPIQSDGSRGPGIGSHMKDELGDEVVLLTSVYHKDAGRPYREYVSR